MLIKETMQDYQAKAQNYLSSHALADFRKSPLLYQWRKQGKIRDEPSPAYVIGSAAHTLILEGRSIYDATYAVGGPTNPKTGRPYGSATKAFSEWAAEQGKPVISDDQAELVECLAASVMGHGEAYAMLKAGTAEGVVRADYCGLPCQSRIDFFSQEKGIIDLKTCDDLTWFESDAKRFGYAYQLAFYRAMMQRDSGKIYPVNLVAVEKKAPYRCGVWMVPEAVLGDATAENEAAMVRLRSCMEDDCWPSGYEDVRVFSL